MEIIAMGVLAAFCLLWYLMGCYHEMKAHQWYVKACEKYDEIEALLREDVE